MTAAAAAAPKQTRVQRIPPVDRKFYEEKIQAIDDEVKGLMTKSQALTKTINEKSTGKEEYQTARDAIRTKRNSIQEQIKQIQQADKDNRTEVTKMQKNIGFQSEEQIDREIADIEYQMHTESLTLKREKELMSKIAQLKQVKPQLNKLSKMKDGMGSSTGMETVGSLKVQLAEIQKQSAAAKEEKSKHNGALKKLTEARTQSMSGVSHHFEEREKLSKQIGAKIAEIKALKEERSQKIKAFNAYMDSQKEVRAEREKADKAVKDAERDMKKKQSDLDNDNVMPFQQELDLIENMIKFCSKLLPTTDASTEAPSTKAPVTAIEGTNVLVSKKDREEFYFVAPTGKKAPKKESSSSADKPYTHSLETLGLFADVKVSPPTAPKDVESTLKQLEAKTGEFKDKQVKEIATRKEKRSEREAALHKAVAAYEKAAEEAKKFVRADETEF
jgi:uncharacterized coiled-coil DUF342 family protein